MKSILLLSQLVIPQLPPDVTEENFILKAIETVSCVKFAEEDSEVHTLDKSTGSEKIIKTILVTVKDQTKTAECAKAVSAEFDELILDSVLPNVGVFIVKAEVPADIESSAD